MEQEHRLLFALFIAICSVALIGKATPPSDTPVGRQGDKCFTGCNGTALDLSLSRYLNPITGG